MRKRISRKITIFMVIMLIFNISSILFERNNVVTNNVMADSFDIEDYNNLRKENQVLKEKNKDNLYIIDQLKKTIETLYSDINELKKPEEKLEDESVIKIESNEKINIVFNSNDVTVVSNATAEDIEKTLKGTGLAGLGNAFVNAEKETGINAIFLASIAALESGWGNSNRAKKDNNLTGYAVYNDSAPGAKFSSKDESIMKTALLISNHYTNKDGKYHNGVSVKSINIKYCTESSWTGKIISIGNKLLKKM